MIRLMQLEPLNIRDEKVQAFLWQYLEPTDFRHDYTRLDAIKEVERQIYEGTTQLVGDLDAGLVFRVVARNPKVCEPHIMGDGTKIRSALDQGVLMAWAQGFEKVVIWTQHDQIARIVERCGFKLGATLPAMHMDRHGELCALTVLTMERPQCAMT